MSPVVVQDGDTLRMWYVGFPTGTTGPNGGSIGYATSTDGINWNRLPAPVLVRGAAGEWDADLLDPSAVIKDHSGFTMWYNGGLGTFPVQVRISTGYATSPDGVTWTKYDDPSTTTSPCQFSDPVLLRGNAGSWDANRAWTARVRATDSGFEAWYAGESQATGNLQVIGYATSADGIAWTKYPGNPVFEAPGTWTNDIFTPSVILDGEQYRMWFSGFQPAYPFAGRIGYATATIVGVDETPSQGMQPRLILQQNYPNPFNRMTRIAYILPTDGHVKLTIYNISGQHIAQLVNEQQTVGYHEVPLRGDQFASGAHFYRLDAGGSTSVKTLLLEK